MAICEGCGNQYDKSFQVIMSGKNSHFRQFRVRHPCTCAIMCPLRRQDIGPRPGERRHVLLLRPLRRSERCAGFARSDPLSNRTSHKALVAAKQAGPT